MPTHLFNPCAPHNDPVKAGQAQTGSPCGNCVNVPRAWEVIGAAQGSAGSSGSGSATLNITDYRGDGFASSGGSVDDSSNFVQVGDDGDGSSLDAWLQFLNVPIPPGATITSATLSLTTDTDFSASGTLLWKLNGSPTSSQSEPTAGNYYTLPRTTHQTTGSIVNPATLSTCTFDATAVVQEIVNGSWVKNGSVMLFLMNNGVASGFQWIFRGMASADTPPFTATTLTVSWTAVNADLYVAQYMGKHVLTRDVAAFADNPFQPCFWKCSIDLTPIGAPTTPGSIALEYTSVEGDGGGDQWFLQLTGLPAIGASPADVAFYKLNAFAFSPVDNRPLRCLDRNVFWREDLLGGGNFPINPGLPDSLIVQPFCP